MSDNITVDELKVFVGTGLKFKSWQFKENECVELYNVSVDGYYLTYHGSYFIDCAGVEHKPIVRPWSHLIKEIEHEGERFVPMLELYGAGDGDIEDGNFSFGTANKRWTTLVYGKSDAVMSIHHNANHLSYSEALKLASWHFDLLNWLNRTDANGNPLAVEMPL